MLPDRSDELHSELIRKESFNDVLRCMIPTDITDWP